MYETIIKRYFDDMSECEKTIIMRHSDDMSGCERIIMTTMRYSDHVLGGGRQ